MILITQYLISRDSLELSLSILKMIALDQCKHAKSMDWIDWKLSKLETIHFLKWNNRGLTFTTIMTSGMPCSTSNRNHSIYWIVNHWNPFKLVNIVSVILLVNLNWRIYHNYNPFKLEQLEVNQTISGIVHLWFEVLNWYWLFEWLDLPNLQSITLGDDAFYESLTTIMESIEWIRMKWL